MRSIEPYQDFNLAMRKTEQDMMLRLLKMAHVQRGKLADAIVSTGINSPQLGPQVAKIAGATARKADRDLARLELLGDRWTAIALGQAGARNALEGLSIVRTGRRLAFATSISIADARAFLTVVATLVDTYFDRRRPAPG